MKCCGETERGNKEKCALGLFGLTLYSVDCVLSTVLSVLLILFDFTLIAML